jgi:hypothetical protein
LGICVQVLRCHIRARNHGAGLIGDDSIDLSQVNLGVGGSAAKKQRCKKAGNEAPECKSGW